MHCKICKKTAPAKGKSFKPPWLVCFCLNTWSSRLQRMTCWQLVMCNPNVIKGLLLFGLSVKLHSHLLLTYDWEGFSHSFVLQRSRQKDVFPQISIRRELFFFFKPQLSPSGGIQALLSWLHFPDPKTTSNYGWISTALISIKGHRAVACPCVTCSVVVQSVYISGIFRILFWGKESELWRKLSKKSNPSNVCAIFNGVNKKTFKKWCQCRF